MNKRLSKTTLALTLAGGLACAPASHACAVDSYISAICAMAWNYTGGFNAAYQPANGQTLPIASYTALFSLLGITYGGDGMTTFKLPDLRGRVIVGAGQGPGQPNYPVGQSGGYASIALTSSQLPQHSHALGAAQVDTSGLSVSTTLNGLTASLSGSAVLKGSSGGTLTKNPSGASLGTPTSLATNIYSNATPTLSMKSGSIDTSGLSVSVNGTANSTMSGGASLTGTTDAAGNAAASIPLMQPYVAMNYFIAINGFYPSRD